MKTLSLGIGMAICFIFSLSSCWDAHGEASANQRREEIRAKCCSIPNAERQDNKALAVQSVSGRTQWLVCRKGGGTWTETVRIPDHGRFYFPPKTADDGLLFIGGVDYRWSMHDEGGGECDDGDRFAVYSLMTQFVKSETDLRRVE